MSRAARRAAARRPLPPLVPDPLGIRAASAAARERRDAETLRQRTQQLLDVSPEARAAFAAMGFVSHTSSGFPVPGPLEPAPLAPAPIEPATPTLWRCVIAWGSVAPCTATEPHSLCRSCAKIAAESAHPWGAP